MGKKKGWKKTEIVILYRCIVLIDKSIVAEIFPAQTQLHTCCAPLISKISIDAMYLLGIGEMIFQSAFFLFRLSGKLLGGKVLEDEVDSATFATKITGILSASIDNFVNLRTISTINRLFEDDNFEFDSKRYKENILWNLDDESLNAEQFSKLIVGDCNLN